MGLTLRPSFVFQRVPSLSTKVSVKAITRPEKAVLAAAVHLANACCDQFDARRPKPARSAVGALQTQTAFVTGVVAAGSLVPTRPVSTCPARRRWNAGLDGIVTWRSYQLLLHDRSQWSSAVLTAGTVMDRGGWP